MPVEAERFFRLDSLDSKGRPTPYQKYKLQVQQSEMIDDTLIILSWQLPNSPRNHSIFWLHIHKPVKTDTQSSCPISLPSAFPPASKSETWSLPRMLWRRLRSYCSFVYRTRPLVEDLRYINRSCCQEQCHYLAQWICCQSRQQVR